MSGSPRIMQRDLEEAIDLDFETLKEGTNEYKLEDGTTLKIRLVLEGVKRLKKHNTDGNPIYLIRSRNSVRTLNISKDLKAKPKVSSYEPVR
ncbi:MAG: hypothetical protein FK732_09745 [Asgard group archaeon]|nr:hypothetical protein [Asgard group archaeon]